MKTDALAQAIIDLIDAKIEVALAKKDDCGGSGCWWVSATDKEQILRNILQDMFPTKA